MGRVCCFAFAIAFTIIAMVALVVASATDYWFEVKNISDSNGGGAVGGSDGDLPRTVTALGSNDTIELENRRFQYPYHVGLWLTCYDEKVPDTVNAKNLVRDMCVLDYDFETKSIEDFARTSEVCLVIACAIMLVSILLGIAGCSCKRKSPLLLSGILLFLSAITTLVGMCSFIARILMQQNDSEVHLSTDILMGFAWSFYVGWGSLSLQLFSGAIFVGGVRGCVLARNKDDNFI